MVVPSIERFMLKTYCVVNYTCGNRQINFLHFKQFNCLCFSLTKIIVYKQDLINFSNTQGKNMNIYEFLTETNETHNVLFSYQIQIKNSYTYFILHM